MSNVVLDESLKSCVWCSMNIRECLSNLVCKSIIIKYFYSDSHQVISMNYFHELGPLFYSLLGLVVCLWLPISFPLLCVCISVLVVHWILFCALKRCVQNCLQKFIYPFGYITNVLCFMEGIKFSHQC